MKKKYVWLSSVPESKSLNFTVVFEVGESSVKIMANFINELLEKFDLIHKNYSVEYWDITGEGESNVEQFYLKADNQHAPMTLLSKKRLDIEILVELQKLWKAQEKNLPQDCEVWINPFNPDWDGYSIIFKEEYEGFIKKWFQHLAEINEADFKIT